MAEARPWNDIIMSFGSIGALQTATTESALIVVPAACELVEVHFVCSVIIDAALTIDIHTQSGGSETDEGALLVPSPTQAALTPAVLIPSSTVTLGVGDAIKLESNGQQTAASLGYFTGIFRQLGRT